MLIAEELVLLLVDDETDKPTTTDQTTLAEAIGGTVLARAADVKVGKARAEELGRGAWAVEAVRTAMSEVTESAFTSAVSCHGKGR